MNSIMEDVLVLCQQAVAHVLTVQVMQLDDEHSIALAQETLCSFTDKLQPRSAVQLHAKGLSHFRNQA